MNQFSTYHPLILLLYYLTITAITVLTIHPVIVIISFVTSIFFYIILQSWRKVLKESIFFLLLIIVITVTNPMFVREGNTILLKVFSVEFTLEALFYGFIISLMFIAVIFWSRSFTIIFTTEKVLFLFAKHTPKIALILTMALRFIPLFKQQIIKVSEVQKTLALYNNDKKIERIRGSLRTFQSIVAWLLENAVIQADAMRARGYGEQKRSQYRIYPWTWTDFLTLFLLISFIGYYIYAQMKHYFSFLFYPELASPFVGLFSSHMFIIFCFMALPIVIHMKEKLYWNYIRSKM